MWAECDEATKSKYEGTKVFSSFSIFILLAGLVGHFLIVCRRQRS